MSHDPSRAFSSRRAFCIFAPILMYPITSIPSARAQALEHSLSGISIQCYPLGDVDHDSKADFLVSTYVSSQSTLLRAMSGATLTELYSISGPTQSWIDVIAGIGDVNGDGSPDIAWAAYLEKVSANAWGKVRIYSGANGALLKTISSPLTGIVDFAQIVRGAGDVDGDGAADFAVPAPGNWSPLTPGKVLLYSGATGALLRTYVGSSPSPGFGKNLDNAGDTDLDGVPDLIVGDAIQPGINAVKLFSGQTGASLPVGAPPTSLTSFGTAVRGLGDTDGDGSQDYGVGSLSGGVGGFHVYSGGGAYRWSEAPIGLGDTYMGSYATSLGDLDQDGLGDVMIEHSVLYMGSSQLATNQEGLVIGRSGSGASKFWLFHPSSSGHSQFYSPRNLGDIDGDGKIELAVIHNVDYTSQTAEIYSPFGGLAFEYGKGCPGGAGFSPKLSAQWVGNSVNLQLTQGAGGSVAAFMIGTAGIEKNLGSCFLVVAQNIPTIPIVSLTGSGPGNGTYSITAPWPASVPYLFLQAFVADHGIPRGYSGSNGVEVGRN